MGFAEAELRAILDRCSRQNVTVWPLQVGVAQATAGPADGGARAGAAERDVCAPNFRRIPGRILTERRTTRSGERPKWRPRATRGVRHEMPNNLKPMGGIHPTRLRLR